MTDKNNSSTVASLLHKFNPKQYIPLTMQESGWAYDGPFSTYKEAHSAILGFAAGYTGDPSIMAAVTSYALGRGATKSKDTGERADAHWRQVAEEPAYALGMLSVGTMARRQGIVTTAVEVVSAVL